MIAAIKDERVFGKVFPALYVGGKYIRGYTEREKAEDHVNWINERAEEYARHAVNLALQGVEDKR